MKRNTISVIGTGLLAIGLLAAQTPQPNPGQQTPPAGWANRGFGPGRMVKFLDLTPDQQTQAKQIFQSLAESNKTIAADMRQARQALADAAKNNATDPEIDRLSQNVGTLTAQMAANRTKAFAKLYSILTPEQRQKMDQARQRMGNRGMRGNAFRGGAGPNGWRSMRRQAPQPQQ